MFTTYSHENKRLVNVVNVVRKYFDARARQLPNALLRVSAVKLGLARDSELVPVRMWAKMQAHGERNGYGEKHQDRSPYALEIVRSNVG